VWSARPRPTIGRLELAGTSDAPLTGILGSDVTLHISINSATAIALTVAAATTASNSRTR